MALHLVTGYAGKTHITSADQGALHAAIFGRENYVLNTGNCFSAQAVTSNSVRVLDGEVIMQGRHIRLEPGAYEEVTIENGTQEYFRNDLICIRYTKDADTGIESASFVVIKGTPDASSAIDPEYNDGNILNGILTVDLPLYRVPLSGLNIGDLVPLFATKGSMDERIEEVSKDIETNASNIKKITNGTTAVGNALKLNGLTAEEFLYAGALGSQAKYYSATVGKDCNDIEEFLVLANGTTATHYPSSGYFYILTLKFSDTSKKQIALEYTGDKMYTRRCISGTWEAWVNSADGGNADTVDNKHATDFVQRLPNQHGGDTVVSKSLTEFINAQVASGVSSGEFSFFNILYNERPANTSAYGIVRFNKHLDSYITVWFRAENQSIEHIGMYVYGTNNTPAWWSMEQYLPLDGSVPMSGMLQFNGGYGRINADGQALAIVGRDTVGSDNAFRGFLLFNANLKNIADCFVIRDKVDGVSTDYTVLHTGNSQKVVTSASAPSDTSALWVVPKS